MDSKDLLMVSLAKFYATRGCMQRIIPIIDGKSDISLRLIDWFVTNFSKKYSTIITCAIDNNIVHFNVYLSYRSQLKAYSKQQFDPFRRRDRIKFYYEKDKWVETTIGQLNFFRWVLQNGIIEYITENIDAIEYDMVRSQKESHEKNNDVHKNQQNITASNRAQNAQQNAQQKKRNELSKSFVKNMNQFNGARMISFD